jgi:hypothetical protein
MNGTSIAMRLFAPSTEPEIHSAELQAREMEIQKTESREVSPQECSLTSSVLKGLNFTPNSLSVESTSMVVTTAKRNADRTKKSGIWIIVRKESQPLLGVGELLPCAERRLGVMSIAKTKIRIPYPRLGHLTAGDKPRR